MTDPDLVRTFAEVSTRDRALAGGKGASLGELTGIGVEVPPGCVVTTGAFLRALAALDADGEIAEEIGRLDPDDGDAVARVTSRIRGRIASVPLPDDLRDAIAGHCADLGGDGGSEGVPVAVRSSAADEDSPDASFAGLQDTYLWVRGGDAVVDHVRQCWASLYNVESVTYRLRRRLPERGLAMGVVVQRMVDPRCAGVMFTRSPVTGDRSVVAIEGSWGLGSALVSGDVTPDTYLVSKVTGEIVRRTVSDKRRRHRMGPSGRGVLDEDVPNHLREKACLSDDDVGALVRMARRVEEHYGCAQDIEWAISSGPDATVFLLQSRPETAWAARAAAPVAAPTAKPVDHVAKLLGGGAPGGRGREATR
ncbi:MAG: PEP/pyruvate-binding domain-containing protein [Streptosporangiaceae bacterium]